MSRELSWELERPRRMFRRRRLQLLAFACALISCTSCTDTPDRSAGAPTTSAPTPSVLEPGTIEGTWRLVLTQPGVAEHRPAALTLVFEAGGTFQERDYCHVVSGSWRIAADRLSVLLASEPRSLDRCVDTTDYLGTPLSATVTGHGELFLTTDVRSFVYQR